MSPSPVRKHQDLAGNLFTQLKGSIKNQKNACGDCSVVYELDWILDNTTVVRPDIAVICNEKGDFITSAPILIIEILSPSTALKDRQVKFDIYEEQGVKYYIVIDPYTKARNIYLLINGRYKEQKDVSSFTIHNQCAVQFDIDAALSELGEE